MKKNILFLFLFLILVTNILTYFFVTNDKVNVTNDKVNVTNDKVNVTNDKVNVTNDKVNVTNDKVNVTNDITNTNSGELYYKILNLDKKYIKDINIDYNSYFLNLISLVKESKKDYNNFLKNGYYTEEDLLKELKLDFGYFEKLGIFLYNVYSNNYKNKYSQEDCISYIKENGVEKSIFNKNNLIFSNFINNPYYNYNYDENNIDPEYKNKIYFIFGNKISYTLAFNNLTSNDIKTNIVNLTKIFDCKIFEDLNKCEDFKKNLINGNKELVYDYLKGLKKFHPPKFYIQYYFGDLTKDELINKLCLK